MRWRRGLRLLRRALAAAMPTSTIDVSVAGAAAPGGSAPPMTTTAPPARRRLPVGAWLFARLGINTLLWYKSSILFLTFVSYTCYHLTRKPISVVKNVLHQNCSALVPPSDIHINSSNNATWCDWAPFDGSDVDATALLGTLDSAFLFAYAIAMFFSGFVAERVDLRYFLSLGMIFSGLFCYMFGLAKSLEIHYISYYIFVQIAAGIAQTTGWPGVVTVVGKWFGKGKRGLIFGIWNSHTSIGNMLGTLIAARFVETDWGLSFIVPGVIMALGGFLIFLFMVPDPSDVNLLPSDSVNGSINTNKKDVYRRLEHGYDHLSDDNEHSQSDDETQVLISNQEHSACHRSHRSISSMRNDQQQQQQQQQQVSSPKSPNENSTLLQQNLSDSSKQAVGFIGALKIPGVIEFSLCLFFAKLVSYTFMYWLPAYIKNSTTLDATESADLSIVFDLGGIAGGILAGIVCDITRMPAVTCAVMLFFAAPMMMIYEWFGAMNYFMDLFLLIIVGLLVNGPYSLITTAISTDLGTHHSLEGNSKALATVTAIIDGTGSIGAAIGPLLAALVSSQGWSLVFYMLIICDALALVLLLRLVIQELKRHRRSRSGPIE